MSGLILLNALLDAQIFVVTLVAPQIDLVQVALLITRTLAHSMHVNQTCGWFQPRQFICVTARATAGPLPPPPSTKSVKQLKEET